jgi:hypothetical protein
MIDAKANEEAPYFTNRRRDSFWSATNGLPQFRTHPRCQALADDIGYMVQARRITGLMFRTLSAENKIKLNPGDPTKLMTARQAMPLSAWTTTSRRGSEI